MNPVPPWSYDAPFITSMEHFESLPHDEIYAKAQQIDPAELAGGSMAWAEIAGTLSSEFPAACAMLDGLLGGGPNVPPAADPARRCAELIAAFAAEFADALASISARLAAIAAVGEAVKLAVVPPDDHGPTTITTSLLSGASLMDSQQTAETLRREAVLVMNMLYAPSYRPAGDRVPRFPSH
jgi:hypothetical protein